MVGRLWSKFSLAFRGLRSAYLTEENIRVEMFLGLLALLISSALKLSSFELVIILAFAALVLSLEYFNTAMEWMVDMHQPFPSPYAGQAKDASSSAVLISSIAALIAALMLWIPRLTFFIKHGISYDAGELATILAALLALILFCIVSIMVPLRSKAQLITNLEE